MIAILEKSNLTPLSSNSNNLFESKNKVVVNFKNYINSSVSDKSGQSKINKDSKYKISEKNVSEDDVKTLRIFNDNFTLISNDIISMLQNMLNNQKIDVGSVEARNALNEQDLVQVVRDIIGFSFIKNNSLDLKELSNKISDILNAEFSIKVTPDEILNAISSKDFQKALQNQLQTIDDKLTSKKADGILNSKNDSILNFDDNKAYREINNLITDGNGKKSDDNFSQNLFLNGKNSDSSVLKKSTFKEDMKTAIETKIEKQADSKINKDIIAQNEFTLANNNFTKNFVSKSENNGNIQVKSTEFNIFDQIIKNINISKDDISSTINIQLKPEFLGKVEINIRSVDGNITANIITDNEKLKHQIETNINILSNQLELKGIKIDNFNVTVDRNMQFTPQYSGQSFNGHQNNESRNSKHYVIAKYELNNESFGLDEAFNYISDEHIDFKA